MKKLYIILIVFVLACLPLCACSRFDSKNVSEFRDEVFVGKTDEYSVTLISGYRETPFSIDGKSDKKADFTLITVSPASPSPTLTLKCSLTVNEKLFEGDMSKHPFEDTYSFEANVRVTDLPLLKINDTEIPLASVKSEDFIDGEKAYKIACEKLSDSEVLGGESYEVYVRLIENPVNSQGGYYWYVAFVDGENTSAVLIDPVTAEVIAQKS